MPSLGKRYPGVEGKTVEFIETTNVLQFVYVRIRFADKTGSCALRNR